MNTIGTLFRFTDVGESHGKAVGGVIDGCPANLSIDFDAIRRDLDRRAGRGLDYIGISERAKAENDEVIWLSGLKDGQTLGTPIAFYIHNKEQCPEDYQALEKTYRPSHADLVYEQKYGIRDFRGGGRASGRETVARVVAGAIAKQVLRKYGISVNSHINQVGNATTKEQINTLLQSLKDQNNSIGAIVSTEIQGLPAGIGEPIFNKLSARLAFAVMSIGGCRGFDFDEGFEGISKSGKEQNPLPHSILGGISTGKTIRFRSVFKPTASIGIGGRHDVCFALRVPPVIEAMTAICLTDLIFCAQNFANNLQK